MLVCGMPAAKIASSQNPTHSSQALELWRGFPARTSGTGGGHSGLTLYASMQASRVERYGGGSCIHASARMPSFSGNGITVLACCFAIWAKSRGILGRIWELKMSDSPGPPALMYPVPYDTQPCTASKACWAMKEPVPVCEAA